MGRIVFKVDQSQAKRMFYQIQALIRKEMETRTNVVKLRNKWSTHLAKSTVNYLMKPYADRIFSNFDENKWKKVNLIKTQNRTDKG